MSRHSVGADVHVSRCCLPLDGCRQQSVDAPSVADPSTWPRATTADGAGYCHPRHGFLYRRRMQSYVCFRKSDLLLK